MALTLTIFNLIKSNAKLTCVLHVVYQALSSNHGVISLIVKCIGTSASLGDAGHCSRVAQPASQNGSPSEDSLINMTYSTISTERARFCEAEGR